MKSLWKAVRITLAVVGIVLILGGVGTSDYHLMEMGQTSPSFAWEMMLVGIVLLLPAVVHALRIEYGRNGGTR